ncbi:hypothetical protein MnTg02_02702 [bacterium MnTg02]|nr:hypothetical protein MnTg02_02702 [bacterium MnTg02]
MRRPVDRRRPRAGEPCQKRRVGLRPAKADRRLVNHLELGRLTVDMHIPRRTEWREIRIICDILPIITEIIAGEGMTIRPFMAAPQMERENAVLFDIDLFQKIRLKLKLWRKTDKPCIAVNRQQTRVFLLAEQQSEIPAMTPSLL